MKIRMGYVTNSSSTNFLILSKQELTPELLYKKLGFKKGSILEYRAKELCEDIVKGAADGLRWYDFEELSETNVKEVFGEKAAEEYVLRDKKGFYGYMGHIGTDDSALTCFFTTDSFEIDDKDFYLNARNCVW